MKAIKIYILFLLWFFCVMGVFTYSILHGKMYMERVIARSTDGSVLFIWDLNRTQILGILYLHSYEFNIYVDGKIESKSLSFQSFSQDIEDHDNLVSYSESHDYETTKSKSKIQYQLDNKQILAIESSELIGNFVTKTDPSYFRYMSNGTWTISIDGISKSLSILSDTIISQDSSHARLSPGIKILGYMWAFWDDVWNMQYIDISKLLESWPNETYRPHSYLLSLDSENKAQKIFGLDVSEVMNELTFTKDAKPFLKVNTWNLIRMSQDDKNDVYYYLNWIAWDGKIVKGFLNLVK